MSIAICVSRFNLAITEKLLQGAVERLRELDIPDADMKICWVPGAVELPLAAQQFAQLGNCEAVICLGAVIRGETGHYEYVCQQVSYGCQRVALDYHLPVIFGVLTTENEQQALERVGGKHGHKGREAADTAMTMINLLKIEN
jgi:6,7-dimethyl-8-ribityllumazine synthase